MTAQILIAPPASGKTYTCAQRIMALHALEPLAPVWVLVSGRLQAAAFRTQLARLGGAFNVRVETFENLYQEILWRGGYGILPTASLALRMAAMQAAVEDARLEYLEPLRALPGFARTIYERISVLQRAAVTPDALAELNTPLLRDLARLYAANLQVLAGSGWINPDGLAQLALMELERSAGLMADLSLLIVDGFDALDAAQCRVLGCLAGRVGELLVTLPGEPGFERPAHRLFKRAYDELTACHYFEVAGQGQRPRLPAALAELESGLLQDDPRPAAPDLPGLEMIGARTPVEESREALRWLKARIVRCGNAPGRCAVLVPKPDLYAPFLRRAADEFGLPLHVHQGQRLAETPAVAAVLNLLALHAAGYPRRGLLDVLRSPFFDFTAYGLFPAGVEQLDLVSRAGKVIEGLEQWYEAFAAFERTQGDLPEPPADEDESGPPRLPRGAEAEELQRIFNGVLARLAPPPERRPITAWVGWLEELLEDFGFYPSGDADVPADLQAALLALRGCLQGLAAAQTALGARGELPVSHADFASQLQTLLENADAADDVAAEGAVIVLSPLEARGLRFEAAAVLGLAEGTFPWAERPDPLLGEEVRARLGMPAKLEQEQPGLFYQLVTRADRALLLTRPYLADSGDALEPSPYWRAVERLFPGRARTIHSADGQPLSDAASASELLFWAALRGEELDRRFETLQPRAVLTAEARVRLAGLAAAPHALAGTAQQAALAREYSAGRVWTVSGLETYTSCPFRFFVESILDVEALEAPAWDYNVVQMGSLLHAVLERTYRGSADLTDTPRLLERLEAAAEDLFAGAPARYGFRPSPLWKQMQTDLLQRLRNTVLRLAELSAGWHPLASELRFGGNLSAPFAITAGRHAVRLRGTIDRVDRNTEGCLRVIDYKAGGQHLQKADLESGRRLQLSVYALGAEGVFGGNCVEGLYYRVGKEGDKNSCRLSKLEVDGQAGMPAARSLLHQHLESIFDRLEQGIFQPVPLEGQCPSYCACASWCWQFNPA